MVRFVPLVCMIVIALSVVARVRLADMPMERDEGEYAYAGQLILQGVAPYTAAYNMKLPGTYLAYAVIMRLFGETPTSIRLGLIGINLATCLLVFLTVRKLFGSVQGWIGAAACAALSVSPVFLGLWAHATHFVSLFASAGLLALVHAHASGRNLLWFASGLAFGAAFVMKQHGVFFMAVGPLVLGAGFLTNRGTMHRKVCVPQLVSNVAGALTPFGLMMVWVGMTGSIQSFWFWTFTYASQYASQVGVGDGMRNLLLVLGTMLPATFTLVIVASAGVWRIIGARDGAGPALLPACFAIASALSVFPGLYFRSHYFITVLPVLSLLMAAGSGWFLKGGPGRLGLLMVCLMQPLLVHGDRLYAWSGHELTRFSFPGNPFVESEQVARYIREHTNERDTIAVIGSEPQIYFVSGRRSATGHIYMYGLMERHPYALKMQEEMAAQVESARPKHVVLAETDSSWLRHPQSETWVFGWLSQYLRGRYELIGMGEYDERGETVVVKWIEDGAALDAGRPHILLVFQRKAAGD